MNFKNINIDEYTKKIKLRIEKNTSELQKKLTPYTKKYETQTFEIAIASCVLAGAVTECIAYSKNITPVIGLVWLGAIYYTTTLYKKNILC